ncbi:hypothetical protein JOY44_23370 [Phormidium sp. CLA17]|uniref:hypothetical protein n=1 Tax=Leptolyngbya sp. Cla-17 TaxID=2803751 RepID=UPI0014910AF3|nr:hypothetical protein [Leptolyngbya sp. Cla-17]MBM0744512.1 hypothetical protein [Leptolyngbya sp. Cla-17]
MLEFNSFNQKLKAAKDHNTSLEILIKLTEDENWQIRKEIARNPKTPAEALEKFAKDNHLVVRTQIVNNPNATVAILEKLAGDKDCAIRLRVAAHPNATLPILEKLSEDTDVQNLRAKEACKCIFKQEIQYARDQEATADVLLIFAENSHAVVREAVAMNPKTPASILEKLAIDPVWFVCKAVAANLNVPKVGLKSLVTHPLKDIRLAIAENPNASIEVLERLVKDKELDVVSAVAQNPNAPAEILTVLAERKDRVINLVAGHPNTPTEILEFLVREQPYDPILPPHTLSYHGLIQLATNPNASAQILTLLAEKVPSILIDSVASEDFIQREFGLALGKAISENPRISESIRKKLSQETLDLFYGKVTQLFNEKLNEMRKDGSTSLESFWARVAQLSEVWRKG